MMKDFTLAKLTTAGRKREVSVITAYFTLKKIPSPLCLRCTIFYRKKHCTLPYFPSKIGVFFVLFAVVHVFLTLIKFVSSFGICWSACNHIDFSSKVDISRYYRDLLLICALHLNWTENMSAYTETPR